jgi:hypothetical protein
VSQRMMRYVFPNDEEELALSIRGGDGFFLPEPKNGKAYLYINENDQVEPELAIFKFFETGAVAEGKYVASITRHGVYKHLFWVNAYILRQAEVDEYGGVGRLDVRGQDNLPEVREDRIDSASS